jgi:putative PIN family toxin of toxin-antitoxin system
VIIVVDSGIWISAIEFGGTPAAALEQVFQADELAICPEIESEVLRVLHDKFGRNPQMIQERLRPFLSEAMRVEITGKIDGACRDPNDDCIVECAVKAGAQLIIAGDKDLLSLREYQGIRIVTARQYLDSSTAH